MSNNAYRVQSTYIGAMKQSRWVVGDQVQDMRDNDKGPGNR